MAIVVRVYWIDGQMFLIIMRISKIYHFDNSEGCFWRL